MGDEGGLVESRLMCVCVYSIYSVGRPDGQVHQDIVLSGSHIEPEHCRITNLENRVQLRPCSHTAMCYVNGKQVDLETGIELTSGSRVIFGTSHVFRFLNPEQARRKNTKIDCATGKLADHSLDKNTGLICFCYWWCCRTDGLEQRDTRVTGETRRRHQTRDGKKVNDSVLLLLHPLDEQQALFRCFKVDDHGRGISSGERRSGSTSTRTKTRIWIENCRTTKTSDGNIDQSIDALLHPVLDGLSRFHTLSTTNTRRRSNRVRSRRTQLSVLRDERLLDPLSVVSFPDCSWSEQDYQLACWAWKKWRYHQMTSLRVGVDRVLAFRPCALLCPVFSSYYFIYIQIYLISTFVSRWDNGFPHSPSIGLHKSYSACHDHPGIRSCVARSFMSVLQPFDVVENEFLEIDTEREGSNPEWNRCLSLSFSHFHIMNEISSWTTIEIRWTRTSCERILLSVSSASEKYSSDIQKSTRLFFLLLGSSLGQQCLLERSQRNQRWIT